MSTTEYTSAQAIRREEHSTMKELTAELLRLAETKADYVIDTQRMSFNSDEEGSWLTFDTEEHDGHSGGVVNDYAHRQISARLGIPKRYYDRMRTDAATLLDFNVGHWFRAAPEKRLIRMQEGKVRAFLSNRYRRLDHDELFARAVAPIFHQYGNRLVFHVAALTDERLYIRAILPELAAPITLDPTNHTIGEGGDVVQAGVEIRNSEVGAGSLSVTPFIWRLRCLNGLVMADRSLSRYHIGREQEESAYAIYQDDTLRADDEALFLKMRDAVAASLSEVSFGEIVKQLRETATGERIIDPPAAAEKLAAKFDLSEDESSNVLRYLATGGDLTQWGAVNAITSAAKDAEDFARQAEMEVVGGELVALPSAEWARMVR